MPAMSRRLRLVWSILPLAILTPAVVAEPATAPDAAPAPAAPSLRADAPWLRLTDDGDVLRLQVAVRQFQRENDPDHTLTVAGAVHIGERAFYKQLQDTLDPLDLVLFEGVMPPGAGRGIPDDQLTDAQKAERTKLRLRLLGILVERHKSEHKALPQSIDDLAAALKDQRQELDWLKTIRNDAWGRPIDLGRTSTTSTTIVNGVSTTSTTDTFDLISRGADGAEGGAGINADLLFSAIIAKEPLTAAEMGKDHGLQKRLARAFRLHFQLEEMNHDAPNWRNSDMSIDELEKRFKAAGADGSELFSMLDGSGFMGQMAGAILGLVERLPGASSRGKMMIMEMLTHADDELLGAGMPGGEQMIHVILNERNDVVVNDVAQALKNDQPPATLGIIYGAGHMPDLIAKLNERFGYRQTGETWLTAMTLDLAKEGVSRSEVAMNRAMIKRQIDMMKRQRRD